MDNQTSVGPPTKKTLANIKRAKAHSIWAGPVHLEWKFWTGFLMLWPRWELMTVEFFNEGPVRWFRCYWLTCGVSIYKALPERRVVQEGGFLGTWDERRGRGIGFGCGTRDEEGGSVNESQKF